MKVKDLQEKLSKLDPNLQAVCYCEDEKLMSGDRALVLLDVVSVGAIAGEMMHLDDTARTPYLMFGKSENSRLMATLEVTAEF